MQRVAIYFAPPAGPLADAAARWLGRDAATGATFEQPDPELPGLTVSARRYGFHATLKAPFRLADGESLDTLRAGVAELAAGLQPVLLEGLEVRCFHGFLALVPRGDTGPLEALAAAVVTRLDRFRAPLSAAEIARRNPDALPARQRALLEAWGYPLVLDEFRFHMTLTDRLSDALADRLLPLARAHFAAALEGPVAIDALALFGEGADGVFHQIDRIGLG